MAKFNETRQDAETKNNRVLDLIYARFKPKLKREFKRVYAEAFKQYDDKGALSPDLFEIHKKNIEKILAEVMIIAMRAGAERVLKTFLNVGWITKEQFKKIIQAKKQEFHLYAAREAETDSRLIAQTTEKDIKQIIASAIEKKSFLSDKLLDLLKIAETRGTHRTLVVGFTNIHGALNFGQKESVKESIDSDHEYDYFKIWVTEKDEKVRAISKGAKFDHVAMEGVKVLETEKFNIPGGAIADGPADRSTPIENWINCRCFLRYRRELKKVG